MADIQIAVIDEKDTQIALAVPGIQGPAGAISSGGSANQVFYKVSGTNYDAGWTFIGNANVDAAAAIAGTKISPNFGSQATVTTGTNTAASFIPTSATIPSNGIYLPGANQVGVATNGTGALFIDGFGRVGIGAVSSGARFEVRGGSGPYMYIVDSGANGGAFVAEATNSIVNIGSTYLGTATVPLALVVGGVEKARIRADGTFEIKGAGTSGVSPGFSVNPSTPANSFVIDSSGRLGIGTSSPSNLFHVYGTAGTIASFERTGSNGVFIALKDGSANNVFLGNTNGVFSVQTPGSSFSDKLVITSAGNVGIGVTGPSNKLDVNGSISATGAFTNTGFAPHVHIGLSAGNPCIASGNNVAATFLPLVFRQETTTGASEAMRIDASGKLLVGTSTARTNFYNSTVSAQFQVEGISIADRIISLVSSSSTGSAGPAVVLGKQNSGAVGGNTVVASEDNLGNISFQGSDGTEFVEGASIRAFVDGTPGANDMPGRLVFSTTADGGSSPSPRMTITNAGVILGGSTSVNGSHPKAHLFKSTETTDGAGAFIIESSNATNGTSIFVGVGAAGVGYNASNCVLGVYRCNLNSRSINAAGSINASGADYAEYMTKAGDFIIAKGDVCGIDAEGKLTNIFIDSLGFLVKSTDPSYVGGDTWGLGLEDDPEGLETARQAVDRVAFAGQVPVNVMGATPGQYIVPSATEDGGITGIAKDEADLTLAEYMQAVGKVIAIEDDGRARIIVKVA